MFVFVNILFLQVNKMVEFSEVRKLTDAYQKITLRDVNLLGEVSKM